jgi:hypothetical protein
LQQYSNGSFARFLQEKASKARLLKLAFFQEGSSTFAAFVADLFHRGKAQGVKEEEEDGKKRTLLDALFVLASALSSLSC